ncbi:MAG: hypothetical protein NVS4B11_06980 [Ktedonobacteraceae bacterium]
MHSKITYRQQFTRCGKQRCRKCRDSEGHGPYWYAYWSEKGRTVSKYIGVHLPPEVIAAREAKGEKIEEIAQMVATSPSSASPVLRVYLLGQFRVERKVKNAWKTVDNRIWQRRRARALLGCLLSSAGRRLGREQVMEQLWPDLDIDVASNRLNGAVHELRQILEPDLARPATSHMLRLERDILELADNTSIWVDVEAFENLLKEADMTDANINPEQAEHLLEEAESFYGGGYLLEELYSEWASHRRDALQRRWVGLLLALADLRTRHGAFVSAIETLDRLRVADPTNETALQGLMRLLTQLDRRGEALHIYRQHVAMMQREYESEPLPETRALYEFLRKGGLPAPTKPQAVQQQEKPIHAPASEAQPLETAQDFTFVRPAFQLGRHNQSPLVGRSREQQVMQQLMLSLAASSPQFSLEHQGAAILEATQHVSLSSPSVTGHKQPHFLLLTGESGIGKTRLAEELSSEATANGWGVAWSRAYEQEGTIAYHLWVELLRPLIQSVSINDATPPLNIQLERLRMLLPEVSTHAPSSSTKSSLSYEQERLYLWEAILGLLSTLSTKHPLLLVLDDVHWTDDSSIELLTYLTHHLQEQRVLLVGTCRDSELAPAHKLRTLVGDLRREQAIVTLAIQPLTHSQIGALVSYLPQDMIESIQTQAAGNPFFAEELARYVGTTTRNGEQPTSKMLDGETDTLSHGSFLPTNNIQTSHDLLPRHSLPDAVAALLERRLRRLSADCQALLGKAAVLGGSFELRQLLPMAHEHSEDIVLDLLDEVLQEGLLTEEGTGAYITYHFWHPLIVNHLYDRLSAARRAQLHRRAADAIKATQPLLAQEKIATAMVNHLSKGGGNTLDIAYYAELAGNQAYSLTAYFEAHYYYLQAMLAVVGTNVVSDATDQAIVQHISSHLLVQPIAHDLLRLCRLLELTAQCSFILGSFEEARSLYECILSLRTSTTFQQQIYSPVDDKEALYQQEAQIQALLWREIVLTWLATGTYDKAHDGCRRGKEVLHQANVHACAAWACLHLLTGGLLRYEGNYQEARRYLQEAIAMLEQFVQHTTLEYRVAFTALKDAKIHTTEEQLSTAHVQTRTERALIGDPADLAYGYELLGVLEASVGHVNDAQRYMRIALVEYEKQERISEVVRVSGNLGAVYIMKGGHAEARKVLHRALDLAERSGDLPNLAFITGNLGDVAHRSGALLEAEAWFKRSLALAERVNDREHISWCCVVLAGVQQDLGYLREAATNLHRAIKVGRAIKNSRCIRFALVSLGALRIVEAIIMCKLQPMETEKSERASMTCQRLLHRAKSTLQRAISQEDVEIETIIDCKLLLATVYFLHDDLLTARQIALQTLQEAQKQETIRVIGRAQHLLGRIFAGQGNYDEADTYFEQAIQTFREQELRLDYARALHSYGVTFVQRNLTTSEVKENFSQKGEPSYDLYQRGLDYLHEARAIFNASHATIDFSWADLVLSNYTAHTVIEGAL